MRFRRLLLHRAQSIISHAPLAISSACMQLAPQGETVSRINSSCSKRQYITVQVQSSAAEEFAVRQKTGAGISTATVAGKQVILLPV